MRSVTGQQVERMADEVLYAADGQAWVLNGDEATKAYRQYAQKHNEYQRTVRQSTDLSRAALREYVAAHKP